MNTPYPAIRRLDHRGLRLYNLGVERARRAYRWDEARRGSYCPACGRDKPAGDHHTLCWKCREGVGS